jgi:GT2 family glycosyltransferase
MADQLKIAVLITCFNRKQKTLNCLSSFYASTFPENFVFDLYLVDDGSTDGTSEAIRNEFPEVIIIAGSGNLYWAGGMRRAFEVAHERKPYNSYLLLNDDVTLHIDFFSRILQTQNHCLDIYKKGGIYSGSTIDLKSGLTSYGGSFLFKGVNNIDYKLLQPNNYPQPCHLTNANILFVEREVIEKIGFLGEQFIHGIADFDFSLRAYKAGFPVYITSGFCGYCTDDHGNNWSDSKSLKQRIEYLKSPLGLSCKEYLFYIKRHFPKELPLSVIKLWLKTLFPFYLRFFK